MFRISFTLEVGKPEPETPAAENPFRPDGTAQIEQAFEEPARGFGTGFCIPESKAR